MVLILDPTEYPEVKVKQKYAYSPKILCPNICLSIRQVRRLNNHHKTQRATYKRVARCCCIVISGLLTSPPQTPRPAHRLRRLESAGRPEHLRLPVHRAVRHSVHTSQRLQSAMHC